jgi:L-lactate dehydrogenase complex protein LldF
VAAVSERHGELAARFTANRARAAWHDQALWQVRSKRDQSASRVPEWEELRALGQAIKAHTISRLDEYLLEFSEKATRLGTHVHFAVDAAEHNRIVHEILVRHRVTRVVKSKSMLTEECRMNEFLAERGIEVVDTDLGERIVQLRGEPPSHIVLPAIHLKREDVAETFREKLGTAPSSDPKYLTEAARRHLRTRFLRAQAGITGVNFAIARTGGIVVCTNEGNADLGTLIPPVHIACMGIEKLIPRPGDLSVFLRLLARSATGQAITSYSSHFHGPRRGGELHVVLLDNGRSELLAAEEHRSALHCIRCGACMNTCPVYRRSGGHSYETHVPGPIGSILAPVRSPKAHSSLPHACTLCGSCSAVCPVGIDLDRQLLRLREKLAAGGELSLDKRILARLAGYLLCRPRLYARTLRVLRFLARWLPASLCERLLFGPHRERRLPVLPAKSFQELFAEHEAHDAAGRGA